MIGGIFDNDNNPVFIACDGVDENSFWQWHLGFPDEDEITVAKEQGFYFSKISVVRHNNKDGSAVQLHYEHNDPPNSGLARATDPVPHRGGLGGEEAIGNHKEDAREVLGSDLHGVAVHASEEGQSPEVRVHPSGDQAIRDSVEGDTEDLRRGRIAESARQQGYTGNFCDVCGSAKMRQTGHCLTCDECGSTTGCT